MHLIVGADFDTCQLFAIGPIIVEPQFLLRHSLGCALHSESKRRDAPLNKSERIITSDRGPQSSTLSQSYLFGLEALRTVLNDKGHARAFVKASIAGRLDRGEVYEYIFAVLARNKSKAF